MTRAIAHLFGTKLSPRDIGSLQVGQFYLRLAGGDVTKVYVQPAWMDSELHAQAIAMGQESVTSARQILRKFKEERDAQDEISTVLPLQVAESSKPTQAGNADSPEEDETMWEEKYEALEVVHKTLIEAHDALAARVRELESGYEGELLKSAKAVEDHMTRLDSSAGVRNGTAAPAMAGGNGGEAKPSRHSPPKYPDDIIGTDLAGKPITLNTRLSDIATRPNGAAGDAKTPLAAPLSPDDLERIYAWVRGRAAADPGILQILANRPELRVTVQRTVIETDGGTLRGALALLISQGFFDSPQNGNTAFNELKRRGNRCAKPNIYRELDKLSELGFVTKEATGYQTVSGMKVNIVEQK
jgi:hypothetical protein